MNWLDILGIAAGICTTIASLPQIKKVWETKEVSGLSPIMIITLVIGLSLWTVYGIGKTDYPIIITNGIATTLNIILLIFFLKHRDKEKSIIEQG